MPNANGAHVTCPRCGTYGISAEYNNASCQQSPANPTVSACLRYRSDLGAPWPFLENTEQLLKAVPQPQDALDQFDLLLQYVAKKAPRAGSLYEFVEADAAVAFAVDRPEMEYLIGGLVTLEFIARATPTSSRNEYRITHNGWERLRALRNSRASSKQAFVAMWFNDEMDAPCNEGIEPALKESGYTPLRIDRYEHVDYIPDAIMAQIRQSRIMVADFTGYRHGVYYETGFARGLSIPVIWTCRKDEFDKAHFDTKQNNHIVWATPAELRERLKNRVQALFPLVSQA